MMLLVVLVSLGRLLLYNLNFQIIYQGQTKGVSGISCAAPTLASFVSIMLNDPRISTGKPPLDLLNPWLYSMGARLLD